MTNLNLSPILIILIFSITFLLILTLFLIFRSRPNSTNLHKPIIDNLNIFGEKIQKLSEGQERLTGGLQTVSEAQALSQPQASHEHQPHCRHHPRPPL